MIRISDAAASSCPSELGKKRGRYKPNLIGVSLWRKVTTLLCSNARENVRSESPKLNGHFFPFGHQILQMLAPLFSQFRKSECLVGALEVCQLGFE